MGEQKESAKNLRRSRIPDISLMVSFYFPIEVCCCRKAAKILRMFLCAPLKVFRLRMTKYCVTQVVAVWFVRFAAGDKPPPYREIWEARCILSFHNSNMVEFLGWRHPKISGSSAINDSTDYILHLALFSKSFLALPFFQKR